MLLATSSLGAVWSSSPPEFGVPAILERFTQVLTAVNFFACVNSSDFHFAQLKPKVLLAVDSYRASGKEVDVLPKLEQVAAGLKADGLERIVLVGQLDKDRRSRRTPPSVSGITTIAYPDFLRQSCKEIQFWRGPAYAPLWVLYSSGTSWWIFTNTYLMH